MRPDATAINILSTTRATAKMREFRVAPEDFIALPRDPAVLFALAVGLLGDVAATLAVGVDGDTAPVDALPIPPSWGATGPAPIDGLRFASVFFDAFLDSQLDETITTEFSLLCASAYYLAGNIGSASVIVRRMEPPELGLAGGLGRLLHVILGNVFVPIEGDHVHAGHTTAILTVLRGYMRFDNDAIAVREAYTALRSAAYANGSPRELIYADLTSAVCATKLRHAARTVLSATSDLDAEVWQAGACQAAFSGRILARPTTDSRCGPAPRPIGGHPDAYECGQDEGHGAYHPLGLPCRASLASNHRRTVSLPLPRYPR
jgi:helicase